MFGSEQLPKTSLPENICQHWSVLRLIVSDAPPSPHSRSTPHRKLSLSVADRRRFAHFADFKFPLKRQLRHSCLVKHFNNLHKTSHGNFFKKKKKAQLEHWETYQPGTRMNRVVVSEWKSHFKHWLVVTLFPLSSFIPETVRFLLPGNVTEGVSVCHRVWGGEQTPQTAGAYRGITVFISECLREKKALNQTRESDTDFQWERKAGWNEQSVTERRACAHTHTHTQRPHAHRHTHTSRLRVWWLVDYSGFKNKRKQCKDTETSSFTAESVKCSVCFQSDSTINSQRKDK